MAKISLSNIAEELAAKSGLTRDAADGFMHAFVATIEKGLQEDGMVKIKGLGTFKLQEMSDRDSVDVNTGDRITIKGYRKVTFTPDSAMKEFVNRPFAHFEPIELNEGYPTEEEPEVSETAVDEMEVVEVAETVSEIEEEKEVATVVETTIETMDKATEATTEEAVTSTTEMIEEVEKVEKEVEKTEVVTEEKKDSSRRRRWGCLLSFLLLLIAAGAYVYYDITIIDGPKESYKGDIGESDVITVKPNLVEELGAEWRNEQNEKPVLPTEMPKENAIEVLPDSSSSKLDPSKEKTAASIVKVEDYVVVLTESLKAKAVKDVTLADTVDYVMEGTLVSHKLKSGETIVQLSNKYYGDKRLWPYIVKYNRMKNFNSVAIGQVIDIPVLRVKSF